MKKIRPLLLPLLAALALCSGCHNLLAKLTPPEGNRILAFRLASQDGSELISSNAITLRVTAGSDLSAVIPLIRAEEGATILPITWNYLKAAFPHADAEQLVKEFRSSSSQAEWALKVIKDNPDFTVPLLTIPINFSLPVMIAVISAQGSTRLYTVLVDGGILSPTAHTRITSFSVSGQLSPSRIDDTAGTVAFDMPLASDLRRLLPSVTVSPGALPLPLTFDYLRRSFPTTDLYDLFMGYYLGGTDYLRDKMKNTADYVPPHAVLDLPIDFSQEVPFAVMAEEAVGLYTVTARQTDTEARLLAFSLPKALNPDLVRDATGTITGTAVSITAWIPAEHHPAKKNVASFSLAGSSAAGQTTSLTNGGSEVANNETELDFASPLTLRASRTTGSATSAKDYTVSVTYQEDPDTVRSVTDFRFNRAANTAVKIADSVAGIYNADGTGVISVTVPYEGAKPAELKAAFYSGGLLYRDDWTPLASGESIPVGQPLILRCRSRDGSRERTYTLNVTLLPVAGGLEALMHRFGFSKLTNPDLAEDAAARIDNGSGTIFAEIKYSSPQAPRDLIADFASSGFVSAEGIVQTSGESRQNFSYPRTYTVSPPYAGAAPKDYRVQLAWTAVSGSACELFSLKFTHADNPASITSDTEAVIDNALNTVTVLFPYGTGHKTADLKARFSAAGSVRFNGALHSGGLINGRFTDGQTITVTSDNGAYTKVYTLRVQETGDILYVNARSRGANTGTSWADAFTNLEKALSERKNIPETVSVSIYIAATADYKPAPNKAFEVTGNTSLYGGFKGTEASPAEREYVTDTSVDKDIFPAGRRTLKNKTRLTASGTYITDVNNSTAMRRIMYAGELRGNAYFDGLLFFEGQVLAQGEKGGGLYLTAQNTAAQLTVTDCDFEKNIAANGAALYARRAEVRNCTFTENRYKFFLGDRRNIGCGILADNSQVSGCVFYKHVCGIFSAFDCGAVSAINGGLITDSQFIESNAVVKNSTIKNSFFGNNASFGLENSTAQKCRFKDSSYTRSGAISSVITECIFDNIDQVLYYAFDCTIKNCTIKNCKVKYGSGSLIHISANGSVSDKTSVIDLCQFENNNGFILDSDDLANFEITNSSFRKNSNGSVIHISSDFVPRGYPARNILLRGNTFEDGTGSVDYRGGITCSISGNRQNITIDDCTFTNNSYGAISISMHNYGGKDEIIDSNIIIKNSRLSANHAQTGGAIYIAGKNESNSDKIRLFVTVQNTVFTNNTATGTPSLGSALMGYITPDSGSSAPKIVIRGLKSTNAATKNTINGYSFPYNNNLNAGAQWITIDPRITVE